MSSDRKVHGMAFLEAIREGRWVSDGSDACAGSGDVLGAVEAVFKRCGWLRKNGRLMSEKTRTDYGNHIMRSFRDLLENGYELQKPWNVEQRHIEVLCRLWVKRGLGASLVQNRLAALSWFFAVVGRPGLVRGTADYQNALGDAPMVRSLAADGDRSPAAFGYEREQVISIAMGLDATFGHMVMLQYALGLRDKEVLRARPLRDLSADGEVWTVKAGSGGGKGGRGRMIYVRQGQWQTDAIARVVRYMKVERRGLKDSELGWAAAGNGEVEGVCEGSSVGGLVANMNRYLRLCKEAGFTKGALGFTGHSFRHDFAHRELEAEGFRAAIRGIRTGGAAGLVGEAKGAGFEGKTVDLTTGLPVTWERRGALRAAKLRVSRQLGHVRVSITGAYFGKVQ